MPVLPFSLTGVTFDLLRAREKSGDCKPETTSDLLSMLIQAKLLTGRMTMLVGETEWRGVSSMMTKNNSASYNKARVLESGEEVSSRRLDRKGNGVGNVLGK